MGDVSSNVANPANSEELNYVATGIWQLFPEFPEGGTLSVIFENNRSTSIKLSPDYQPPDWLFDYDEAKVFRYLFGYAPKKVEDLPGWYKGGHEGFFIEKKCFGDGLATSYMNSSLGDTDISIYADSACR